LFRNGHQSETAGAAHLAGGENGAILLGGGPRLLIINADDWGMTAEVTDKALECFQAGCLTSSTAMVYMADSQRAASLASIHPIPLGLHLNLTEPFTATAPRVPADVRRRQARVAAFFGRSDHTRWIYNPMVRTTVREVISDQIARFTDTYGRTPTHIDSHHHIHVSPNILLDGGLPTKIKLRRTFTFIPGQSRGSRAFRDLINTYMGRRFTTTDHFFAIRPVEEAASLPDIERSTVEMMVHPADPRDYALLMGEPWRDAIERWKLGSYTDLQPQVIAIGQR
jgi:chitin disaccharide deacetylase